MTNKAAEMVLKAEEQLGEIKNTFHIALICTMLAQVDLLAEIVLHLEEMKLSIERSRGL